MYPKLSVITVVYNNVKDIERTMQSVLDQTYKNIEYIVIDGGSTDGTQVVIEKYRALLGKYISEPDEGIYHAMNKGLSVAKGDYVLFINSGDEIYARDTVEHVFEAAEGADIYYGETEMYDEEWKSLGRRRHCAPEVFTWRSFRYGMSVSHQAIFVKKSLAVPFDLQYRYSSDIDWIISIAKTASSIVNTHQYVAKYLVGGISKKKHFESLKERFVIFSKYYGPIPNVINHFFIIARLLAYFVRHRRTND